MTQQKRDWVRIIGITGATLVLAGGLTLGGLRVAEATGLVTMPTRQHGQGMQNGFGQQGDQGMMGGFGKQNGQGKMGGRRGDRHGDQGMMGGFGQQGGQGNRGMMGGFGQQQAAGDEQLLTHLIQVLTEEQASATAVGATESAAKAIAATRTAQVGELTALLTKWYPSATAPAAQTGNATTVEELRQELLHHSQMLEGLAGSATFEHPELKTWLTGVLATRATEVTTLYSK